MATCYRHPSRETGVSCSNCGNPICPDCMTSTPVGMRCPDCAGQKQRVHTMRSMHADPTATYVLIAINVLLFLGTMGQGAGRVYLDFVLWAPAVADGEIYRLVTSGFLHDPNMPRGLLHIGFNMYLLWWLGNMLEPMLGHARFVALYFAALICGSFGALLLTPEKAALGASGAVFGLMAAAFVLQRARGIDPMQSGIGPLILFNLVLGFVIPNVSIGGHLGGLVGGALVALAFERVPSGRWRIPLSLTACAVIAVLAATGAVLRATGVTG